MKCSNCGSDLKEGLKFCPYCGTTISDCQPEQNDPTRYPVQEYVTESFENTQGVDSGVYNRNLQTEEKPYYYEEPAMYRAAPERAKKASQKNIWLIVAAIVLGVAVVTVAVLFLLLGSTDEKKEPEKTKTYECEICGEETENKDEYCDDCIENYGCEYCDSVSEDIVDGFCEDCEVEYTCRACDTVDEEVEDGYCPDCLEDMKCRGDNCNEILEEGYYCDDCIEDLLNEDYEGLCFICDEEIDNEDIFVIDTWGYAYCEDCDTGNYCTTCYAYIDDDDDDEVCFFCADYYCYECSEVLESDEISVTDDYDNDYCEDCDTGYYCEDCGAPVRKNRDYCNECSSR